MEQDNHLIIDQGNTTTKIGVFHNRQLIQSARVSDDEWLQYFSPHSLPQKGLVSTVRANLFFPKEFAQYFSLLTQMNEVETLPISVDYETPNTLGHDRIANAVGAVHLHPLKNVLVIDCGSCITSTFIHQGSLKGGSISLGLAMRLKAIHEFTGKLPLLKVEDLQSEIDLIGKNTKNSILSGIAFGSVHEVDQLIEKYCSQFPDLIVILTGGDASFFASRLKYPIFAEPNLTLQGLNEIYIHTAH